MFRLKNKKQSQLTPESIHKSARETELAMNEQLISINKSTDPNYIAVKNLLVSYMYTTNILEDTIFNIFKEFCKTQSLPAMNTIPGFNDHSKITILTGGLVQC